MRTHRPGLLGEAEVGTEVVLCGWVAALRDQGGVVFLDLRDATGIVQVVADPAGVEGGDVHELRREWVLRVCGELRRRPAGTENPALGTGTVEVAARRLEVLNRAEPPPMRLDDRGGEVDEVLRLRHRYLDLRRPSMQANLRLRARVNAALRASMAGQDFVEVETPVLVASTPEGARDFVVPSRLHPGRFYALPQSPQLFKQLLMVGGLDRYFQIARCLRDEDLRADRQFEFMQYDAEMSFADEEDVIGVVTEAVAAAVEAATGRRPDPPDRLTWTEAMDRYGTDKPDLRFGMPIVDVTAVFAGTGFRALQAPAVRAIAVPAGAAMGRAARDRLVERARERGAPGLLAYRAAGGDVEGPGAQHLSAAERSGLLAATGAGDGDLVLVVAADPRTAAGTLGALRNDLGRPPVSEGGLRLAWVTEFPLFEGLDEQGRPVPAHHPFTAPHPDDLDLLRSGRPEELLQVRSRAYDLVCNGWELGSGSVRIHDAAVQALVFERLGIGPEAAEARFGFLLEAFRYGAPPHAGFAFGIDRLVAILAGEENIREVIAFPKTASGTDPLTGAPTPLPEAHLRELGLALRVRPG
jgi:aspartyl-tRNA synthetase